jgi:hypothetical protein
MAGDFTSLFPERDCLVAPTSSIRDSLSLHSPAEITCLLISWSGLQGCGKEERQR